MSREGTHFSFLVEDVTLGKNIVYGTVIIYLPKQEFSLIGSDLSCPNTLKPVRFSSASLTSGEVPGLFKQGQSWHK